MCVNNFKMWSSVSTYIGNYSNDKIIGTMSNENGTGVFTISRD